VTDLETGDKLEIDNKYIMSPKDLCTIEFMDKMIDAGVSVFKIEGRARSAEYVRKVTAAYRAAADAVIEGRFTPELASSLKEGALKEVFNRGFWDGYYQGAKLGEWSTVYGNKATRKKTYIGKVTNYFSNIGVAEILIETGQLEIGNNILIIGPSTGVIEMKIPEIRVDLKPSEVATKGVYCSIPIPERLRRSDKVYLFE
jgi:putative protease